MLTLAPPRYPQDNEDLQGDVHYGIYLYKNYRRRTSLLQNL